MHSALRPNPASQDFRYARNVKRNDREVNMEYIQIYKIEKNRLKKKIAEDFNVPSEDIKDEFLKFMEEFVEAKHSTDEYIKSSMEIPPSTPPVTLFLLIPRIYYHINVKKATYMTIGLLLDLFITRGVATFSLSMLGMAGQTIGKLNTKNGEVCVYYQALTLKKKAIKEFGTEDVLNKIGGEDCLYSEFKCSYNQNGKCNIKLENLKENFQKLEKIGAFSRMQNDMWRVEL
jgi:hypothetical protein